MQKTMLAILKVLEKNRERILGSREIARQLRPLGIELTERTVRYHLKILDERGLTNVYGKEGRKITGKGMEELASAFVSEKVGFIISKIETLSYQTDLDLEREEGKIILNVSYFRKRDIPEALRVMRPVFASPYIMCDRVALQGEGGRIGELTVPEGMVGIGTVCSVTVNGIFLKAGIPVVSRFGGLLDVDEGGPSRFLALISYGGSSLDPHEMFIRGRMTDVTGAARHRRGKVLASFREIPVVSLQKAMGLEKRLRGKGISGILKIGNPNQPLFEVPVGMDKTGMVLAGGLNPVAAAEEAGIHTESTAMAVLYDYQALVPFKDVLKKAL